MKSEFKKRGVKMIQTGEMVYDRAAGARVEVLERMEVWGCASCRVFNPATGQVYRVAEDQLGKEDENRPAPNENYLRYLVWLSRIKNQAADGFLSSSPDILPLPHQIHVLKRALSNPNIRYILADEVGLGKTIEAGMIIKELKSRGLVKRVLVVCPTGLVTQWAREMREKFHEKFQVILPSDFDTIRRLTDSEDVYGQFDQVISPMDSIKPLEKRSGWSEERVEKYNEERIYSIINSGWDLVIIDEAHRVAGSTGEIARYRLGSLLSQASPYLLLLTATPHNGKTEPFLRLVRLLDQDAFPNAKSIVREQVAPFLIRTEKREAIDNEGNRLFKNRVTHLVSLSWDSRNSLQRDLYQMVSSYVASAYKKALRSRKKNMCLIFLLIIMQRMVTSSTAAILESLQRRLDVLQNHQTHPGNLTEQDLDELDVENGAEDALEALSLDAEGEIQEVLNLIEAARQARFQNQDAKAEPLLETIESLLAEDPERKIIVFTEFVATEEYLQDLISRRGIPVTVLNGSMGMEERNAALEEFRDKTPVFISTDAGGEGLNLQFASVIINYDLPWNPMKIEQRCGRVDRIGQKRDVDVYNFILQDTVENRVRQVLEEKLSVITREMGVDKYSDVLDSEVAEYDFTEVYMDSLAHPGDPEKRVSPVEAEIKRQMANVKKYKDVIREDKDLHQLLGEGSSFDAKEAIRTMMGCYERWQGKNPRNPDSFTLEDEEVQKCLHEEVFQDYHEDLPLVRIRDFPNEAGYFMLWKLSISEDEKGMRILPVFVNSAGILRPLAGKRLMDVFLDENSRLEVTASPGITDEEYQTLEKLSLDFASDTFLELKEKHLKANEENARKYRYALKLRMEAAGRIGIDNIRRARLDRLSQEKIRIEEEYQKGMEVCPDFRLMMLARLEA